MSKRDLKQYLKDLKKPQLEEQILDLYTRFKNVKTFYDFAFNPNENRLLEECKRKISNEYFPVTQRKPKARRSVAQKFIRHFKTLGVDVPIIADVMLYNIEIAQTYSTEKRPKQESFYKSMLNSFEQALEFIFEHGYNVDYQMRIEKIVQVTISERWINSPAFERIYSEFNFSKA